MPEAPAYDAYLEVDQRGIWLASILDLDGCCARGANEAEALAGLAASLPEYFAWLRRHDDYTPDVHGPWQVVPRETFRTHMLGEYEVNAFFTPDAQPVDDEALDWALALLGWAHEDLLALVSGQPATLLDRRAAAGEWSVREILGHVARSQLWYVSLLDAQPGAPALEPVADDPIAAYRQIHAVCARRLRHASEAQRTAVYEHEGERWSLRKVLRRSIWHVRDHSAQIERALHGQPAG